MKSKKIIPWIAVMLWMAVIFSLSAQPGASSDQLSIGLTEIIVEMIQKVTNVDLEANDLNHFVRKNAHFIAYLILGGLVSNALKYSGNGSKIMMLAGLICAGFAVSDEIHQMFVPGRGPQINDVFIDSVGAAVGIISYQLLGIRRSQLSSRNQTRGELA